MPSPFRIDPASVTAPFEQLRTQVISGVKDGTLVPGTKLPTVRNLADELGLAPNTIARAYRELEHDDVIETRGRNGTFVSSTGDADQRHAQQAAIAYAERTVQLGLTPAEALAIVTAALHGTQPRVHP
ncbi:GntR family transcriptional regulator [Leifsonia sp. ALI-44-B]|uniref:GntR family transcriptional regulator n=1 Tax=Leifsonia sp. ALI-44-B TaxID=1933776 RepID=UPI00097C3971|nr:GntR family transcriptional regulator [Leifsonia sp. ALI-44-B]ONI60565.1 GntR family transcriptional regulator [Leifsonia sp. ALI-44-B]